VCPHDCPQTINPNGGHSADLLLNLEITLQPSSQRLSVQAFTFEPTPGVTSLEYTIRDVLSAPD